MENKTSRYFKYAIGEIFLVVIGILIALQINNWNEARKHKNEEIQLLKELRKDVAFGVQELDTVSFYAQKNLNYLKIIQDHLYDDLPYSKVLDTAFGYLDTFNIPYLPKTSYETLKVRGIDRLENDSLKSKILKTFDFKYQEIINDYGNWEWSFSQNTTQRMMIGNIRRARETTDYTARPNDYEALKTNEEFGNFLNVLVHLRTDHINALKDAQIEMQELLKILDKELLLDD